MAVTITNDDLSYLLEQVLNAIRSESQSVEELETVGSLTGIHSLPALQGQKVVKAPIALLGQPATQAAATANAAASNAGDKAALAVQATGSANAAAALANTMALQAENASRQAEEAARNAQIAAQSAVRKITTKDRDGESIAQLTPDENGNVDLMMTGGGSGSGSGFYNVTLLHPLENDFYTKETAVAALANAEIVDQEKPSMIITFEVTAGKWIDYRFEGSNIDSFLSPAAWNRYGGGDAIKKLTVSAGTNTQELTPDENGHAGLEIPVTEVDETLTAGGTNPVQGGAVKAAIEQLESQFGASIVLNSIGEGDEKAYSFSLLDKEGEVLSTTETFTGGGGSGSALGTRVILTRITPNPIVKLGDEVKLQFLYDQINTETSESTGNGARAVITISRGATSNVIEMNIAAGSTITLEVTPYLGLGNNAVRVRITTGDEAAQVASISWNIQTIRLRLESSFNIATAIHRGNTVSIPYTLNGSGAKTIRMYLDGKASQDTTVNASSFTGSFIVNTSGLSHGSHSVQIVAELEQPDGTIIKSNSIYFDLAIREAGNNTPVFATRFDYPDGAIIAPGDQPYIETQQYDTTTLIYAAYNPQESPTHVEVYEEDNLISSASVAFVRTDLTIRTMMEENIQCRLVCGETEYPYMLNISPSELEIYEPTADMTLKLSAIGRSNSDANKEEWNYNEVTTSFENFVFGGDGWIDNALRIIGNAKATINFAPLATPAQNASEAMALMIRFRVTNVMNESAEIIKCMDASGTGFVITTQEARFVSRGGSTVTTKFASGEIYHIGFVAYPKATDQSTGDEKLNDRMLYLYINGVMSGGVQRGESDSIYQQTPKFITMGSLDCTLDVFSVRAYNSQLTHAQMLDAYMIDLGSAEELINKYMENDILDDNGLVDLDKIRLPYLIVTGSDPETGVPSLIYAKAMNQKDPKYNVSEMLFVHPDDQTRNFRCVGGCVRLQGTSSMAYPMKNYRIYFKDADKVEGQLYLGCDKQGVGGELQAKAKYSLRQASDTQKQAAPVDCFCLKADFAESSSGHNTGLTKLVHRVTEAAGDLTPAQEHVDASYPYDVRTCVDGYPCLVLYRNTVNETPVLLGKFNFNNDKSTEAVFGFLDIPGYHDQNWIEEKFGGENPTECWEFLNNDYPMGSFLDDDFDAKDSDGTFNWLKMFETRFPETYIEDYENGMKPTYLMPLVKWVKSTANDPTKFRNELSNYFDVDYLCDYFMITEVFGCVDQRVKNMMLGFWYKPEVDKVLGYMVFYDCDTILGLRNDGRLKYNWDLDHNTTDPELSTSTNTVYAFAGHNSVLWNNLRELFPDELAAAYIRLRAQMSNNFILNIFDNEQSSQFNARTYNIDAVNKYVVPATKGTEYYQNGEIVIQKDSYMEAMQGSRKAHRRWWLENRLRMFDARYSTGDYASSDLNWKGYSTPGATIRAWATRDFFFAIARESAIQKHTPVAVGDEWNYTYNYEANIGTIFHFYGGEMAFKLDLSDWGGFQDLSLPNLPFLEELILGKDGVQNSLSEIIIGDKIPKLRKLEIRNYVNLPTLNLSGCIRLEEVNATGSSLSTISFAPGCPLKTLLLPEGYKTLILRSMPDITRSGIVFASRQNMEGLWVENCPKLDGFALFQELRLLAGNKLKNVRMAGLDMSGSGDDLLEYYNSGLGGFDASGNVTVNCKLAGSYQLTKYMDETMYEQLTAYFDELNIRQPEYTCIEFDDAVADPANISNLDNRTGYKFGNLYEPSAHIQKILSLRHRVLGKKTAEGEVTIFPLHDENSNFYADSKYLDSASPAVLTGPEGNVWVYEPHYWYKGVNDIRNMKKYSVYSTYEKISVPEGKKILMREINLVNGFALRMNQPTLEAAKQADLLKSYGVVDLEGYQRVRVPGVASSIHGVLFLDNSNNVLDSFVCSSEYGMVDGMYLFFDVPQEATRVAFTVNPTVFNDLVWMTNSKNIADMEPEWAEHKECLTGVYKATVEDGIARTRSGVEYSRSLSLENWQSYYNNLGLGFSFMSWDDYSCLANLILAASGNRDSQLQFGYGFKNMGANATANGSTNALGMKSTVSGGNLGPESGAWHEGANYSLQNVLGYESLLDLAFEMLDKIAVSNGIATINRNDGARDTKKLIFSSSDVDSFFSRVWHQKYMDILPADTSGSESTYYCDSSYMRGASTGGVIVGSTKTHLAGKIYGLFTVRTSARQGTAAISTRVFFTGAIVFTETLQKYKSLIKLD